MVHGSVSSKHSKPSTQFLRLSGLKKKGMLLLDFTPSLPSMYSNSVTAGQISMGRRLRRTVDMFSSARDLVEENDRRLEMMGRSQFCEFSSEYALLPL
jgi:hypothetical protein